MWLINDQKRDRRNLQDAVQHVQHWDPRKIIGYASFKGVGRNHLSMQKINKAIGGTLHLWRSSHAMLKTHTQVSCNKAQPRDLNSPWTRFTQEINGEVRRSAIKEHVLSWCPSFGCTDNTTLLTRLLHMQQFRQIHQMNWSMKCGSKFVLEESDISKIVRERRRRWIPASQWRRCSSSQKWRSLVGADKTTFMWMEDFIAVKFCGRSVHILLYIMDQDPSVNKSYLKIQSHCRYLFASDRPSPFFPALFSCFRWSPWLGKSLV